MSANEAKIRNVGPKSAAWLRQVGIRTPEDLARIGAVEAFLKVKRAGFRPSLNLLYSMAGALADCHWAELPDERKKALLANLESAESANPIRTRWEKQKAASETARTLTGYGTTSEEGARNESSDSGEADSVNDGVDSDISRFD